ncbi:MAG TPA: DNA N-6-adenine-methyltransferase [Ktedonobacteraceae bacterium]|nr:DNA N-6-adenine-methyltransferase [Ktedonobacteraceae bacterium]
MTLTHLSPIQHITLPSIRIDGGTQSRVALNEEYITELAQALSEGENLPPIILFSDGSEYWLADGFHRYYAVKRQEQETIASEVKQGTRHDAVLFSVGANAQHGLRRTNADKRRAVETLLGDPEWVQWSDRKIAKACGVDNAFVGKLRKELSVDHQQIERLVERNRTIYTMSIPRASSVPSGEQSIMVQECLSLVSPFSSPSSSQGLENQPIVSQLSVTGGEPFPLAMDWDGKEEQAAASLGFTGVSAPDFHRDVVGREKERRDAHVLRIMGSSESPEWYTPSEIVALTCELLGEIDLDPCSNSHDAPAVPARVRYTKEDNGLAHSWRGKTYLNPPYGSEIPLWVSKLIQSYEAGSVEEAIALLPGRIDTVWFQPLYAYLICHIQGRLQFANSPYHAPFPCVIVYLGTRTDAFIDIFKCKGPILRRVG